MRQLLIGGLLSFTFIIVSSGAISQESEQVSISRLDEPGCFSEPDFDCLMDALLTEIERIGEEPMRDQMISQAALIFAASGNESASIELVRRMGQGQESLLNRAVRRLVISRDLDGAMVLADEVAGSPRSDALQVIAAAFARDGQVNQALELLGQIEAADDYAQALIATANGALTEEQLSTVNGLVARAIQVLGPSIPARRMVELQIANAHLLTLSSRETDARDALRLAIQSSMVLDSPFYRVRNLVEIAAAFDRLGDASEANRVFQSARDSVADGAERESVLAALFDIALAQGDSGYADSANETLDLAVEVASQADSPLQRERDRIAVAYRRYAVGNANQALQELDRVRTNANRLDGYERNQILYWTSQAFAALQDWDEAIQTAALIDRHMRDGAIAEIASTASNLDFGEVAREITFHEHEGRIEDELLSYLALAEARADQRSLALALVASMQSETLRLTALVRVSAVLSEDLSTAEMNGMLSFALLAARNLADPRQRIQIFVEVVAIQADRRDFDVARETIALALNILGSLADQERSDLTSDERQAFRLLSLARFAASLFRIEQVEMGLLDDFTIQEQSLP